MTTEQSTHTRYRRSESLSWRDTGRHVLVARVDSLSGVLLLEGGNALLWRLLEQPDTATGLAERLASLDGAPDAPTLQRCLDDLTDQGVLCIDGSGESR